MTEIEYQRSSTELFWVWFRLVLLRKSSILCLSIILVCSIFVIVASRDSRAIGEAGLVFVFVAPLGFALVVWRLIRSDHHLTAKTTLQFGETGIVIRVADVRSEIGWSAFNGWTEKSGEFLLLSRGNPFGLMIPKRAFTSDQLASFRGLLQRVASNPKKS